MKILSLELSNFSRHTSLKIAPKGGVVGILGPNGSGKSSILTALEFALTGQARDNLDSYLKLGATSGAVLVQFEHQGKIYYIHRTVGKSSRRWLHTPDGKITAAKEVDEALNRIFDVDKKTLSNAVFVKQGELQQLLFGTCAERRTQLIRLTNLSYLANRVILVTRQRDRVKAEMVDLAPLREQMTRDLASAEESFKTTYDELMALPDVSAGLEQWRAELVNIRKIDDLNAQMADCRRRRQEQQGQIANEEQTYNTSLGQLTEEITAIHATITQHSKQVQDYYRILVSVTNLEQVKKDIVSQEARVQTAEQVFKNALAPETSLEELQTSIQQGREKLQRQEAGTKLSDRILKMMEVQRSLKNQKAGLKKPEMAKEDIALRRTEYRASRDLWVITTQQYKLLKEMSECFKPGETKCPKCGLEVSNAHALVPESLEAMRLQNEQEEHRLEHHAKTLAARESEWSMWEQVGSRLTQQLTDLERQLLEANTEMLQYSLMSDTAATELKSQVGLQDIRYREAGFRQTEWNTQRGNLNQLQHGKTQLENSLVTVPDQEKYTVAGYSDLQKKATDLHNDLKILQARQLQFQSRHTEVESLNKQMLVLHKRMTAIPPSNMTVEDQAALPAEISKMEAMQRARDQASGVWIKANSVLQELRTKWDELLEREKGQQLRQEVVTNLDKLISWLSEDGLPQRFLQKQFLQLQNLTQHHLSRLGANFTLSAPDLDQLEMRFFRPGDVHESLSMQKLSGGQKIRLGMSFLLAVQQLLVPQLGLLVLDEPSTHLDEDGVEALAQMLAQLGGELSAGGISFWLADHHPLLQRGLSDVCLLPD